MKQSPDTRDFNSEKLANALNQATSQIGQGTLTALREARHAALARQLVHKPGYALSTGHDMHWILPHSGGQWAAAILLMAAIFIGGVGYWQHTSEIDTSHLDIAILTDDLPIEVFVDQ